MSEIERSRNILWKDCWQRVDTVELELRTQRPESFRRTVLKGRNSENKTIWAFAKVVRLRKYGRKRLVMIHEQEDLQDAPRFLLTDALHWASGRVMETWTYQWSCEVFHEVEQTGDGVRIGSGSQSGSGETSFSLKLCSAVDSATSNL